VETRKSDRRVKYTRMVIKESLIRLLKVKPITKITVKEICDGAEINRATFYAHYRDQHDLLLQIETELLRDIDNYLQSEIRVGAMDEVALAMLENVFTYIRDNAELCSALLNTNAGDINFQQQIVDIFGAQFIAAWSADLSMSEERSAMLFEFAASGSVGIVRRWLDGGMSESPGNVAELLLKLTTQGMSAFR
jgi:AcrR family transcriptional regulator